MTDSANLSASFGKRARVQTRATGPQRFHDRLRRVAGRDSASARTGDVGQTSGRGGWGLEIPAEDDRWSPRRTLAFVVIASAGLWGLIAMAIYGSVMLLRH